jgi:putative sigma-54 modulation protein
MRVEITGRHISVTDGLRTMVEKKLVRLERVLNDSAVSAQVVFALDKTAHRVDITVHARDEKFLHGAGKGGNWPSAVNAAVDKIAQQAKTIKGKYQARKRQPARARSAPPETTGRPAAPRPEGPGAGAGRMPAILRQTRQAVQPMTVAAAMRQLTANGNAGVVVFRDEETAFVAVLYRDASGELLLVNTDV